VAGDAAPETGASSPIAMLHDQLETRPGFAEAALHALHHSAKVYETHPDYLAPYLRLRHPSFAIALIVPSGTTRKSLVGFRRRE